MDSYLQLALAALLVLAAILLCAQQLALLLGGRTRRRDRLPPGPKPWPVVGNLPHLLFNQQPDPEGNKVPVEAKLTRLAQKYGPIMHLKLGSVPAVVISSPQLAREILKEQDVVFAHRPAPSYAIRELTRPNETIGLSSYGPSWRFSRKVLTLELLTHKRIQQYRPVRQEEIDAMVKAVGHSVATQPGKSVDLLHQFRTVTFNTVTRIALGKRYISQPGESDSHSPATLQVDPEGKDRDMFREVVGDYIRLLTTTHMVGDFVPYLSFLDMLRTGLRKSLRERSASTNAFFERMLDEHRLKQEQHPEEPARDIMDDLLKNIRNSSGEAMTDARVKAVAKAMILGGVDSTSTSLKYVLVELLREPQYLQRAQQELDHVVGRHRKVEEADIPNLPLLRAIIKETWRLKSGLLVPRCPSQDTQLAGYDIPANTTVLVNVHGISRDPAVWPHPHRFLPDRFLTQRPDVDVRGQHFELLVFGSGRRSCPGLNLGIAMVEIILARLLHSFDLSLPAEHLSSATQGATVRAVPSLRLPSHLY